MKFFWWIHLGFTSCFSILAYSFNENTFMPLAEVSLLFLLACIVSIINNRNKWLQFLYYFMFCDSFQYLVKLSYFLNENLKRNIIVFYIFSYFSDLRSYSDIRVVHLTSLRVLLTNSKLSTRLFGSFIQIFLVIFIVTLNDISILRIHLKWYIRYHLSWFYFSIDLKESFMN